MTKDHIFNLLSPGEVSNLSIANAQPHLGNGDEYLDLERLDQGVQRAHKGVPAMGQVLPRKAIYEDTWRRILRQLKAAPA